ncbi:OapA family protein [Marinobacter sp. V034]|uniref:OapA family protein n=1 Tax=Marinobacter sp. V034 TaxID=3459610 RepID=UPI0040450C2F
MLNSFPKTHLLAAGALSAVVGLGLIFSPSAPVEAKRTSLSLDLDSGETSRIVPLNKELTEAVETETASVPANISPVSDAQKAAAETTASPADIADSAPPVAATPPTSSTKGAALKWQDFTINSGDNLSALFSKAGFDYGLMLSVIHGEGEAKKIERLYEGETISFATNADGELERIKLSRNRLYSLLITRTEDGFKGETVSRTPEQRTAYASGKVDGSLYLASRGAGLSDRLTMELVGIFGWDIDFVYDIRKGDHFEILYEDLYLDNEKFDTGRILAATFVNRGKPVTALLYTDKDGHSDYYTPEGSSLRKAFLRTPINARVSSAFNLQRRHPVLDVVRPHEGTDYAAPPGTPIKAAGDGRIRSAGWKGGYGRTVVIQHGDNISTLYAHMRAIAKGMKSGARIKQGQTIGYVGSSGMVTGPHLHYEFRVNGSPRNSRTVKLPDASPIPKSEMASFKAATQSLLASLNEAKGERQLALADSEEDEG